VTGGGAGDDGAEDAKERHDRRGHDQAGDALPGEGNEENVAHEEDDEAVADAALRRAPLGEVHDERGAEAHHERRGEKDAEAELRRALGDEIGDHAEGCAERQSEEEGVGGAERRSIDTRPSATGVAAGWR